MKLNKIERHQYPLVIIISVIGVTMVVSLLSFGIKLFAMRPLSSSHALKPKPAITKAQFDMDVSQSVFKVYRTQASLMDALMKLEDINEPFETIERILSNVASALEEASSEIAVLNPSDSRSRDKKARLMALIEDVQQQIEETRIIIRTGDKNVIQRGLKEVVNKIDRIVEFSSI